MEEPTPGAIQEVLARRGAFATTFLALFIVAFIFLSAVGATPDPLGTSSTTTPSVPSVSSNTPALHEQAALPVRLVAPTIKLDVSVSNPTDTSVAVLDKALLTGAVRYPTSAQLGQEGTMVVFGHSSYLPVVRNQAFKEFNGIQNLKNGEIISVYSADTEDQYRVVSVKLESAKDDTIELSGSGKHLALVTCDSFGEKTDRFVVVADFVRSYKTK